MSEERRSERRCPRCKRMEQMKVGYRQCDCCTAVRDYKTWKQRHARGIANNAYIIERIGSYDTAEACP